MYLSPLTIPSSVHRCLPGRISGKYRKQPWPASRNHVFEIYEDGLTGLTLTSFFYGLQKEKDGEGLTEACKPLSLIP